ncbi:MAG: SIR2 family protein [Sphingomonas sp.]|nr:SIR2 family protein [Sphingomonas sp.]
MPEAEPPHVAKEVVASLLENFDCQPVLFVGAGLARRYIGAPDWEGALRYALQLLPNCDVTYEYLSQKHGGDKVLIGTEIGDLIFEWAWKDGKGVFSESLFSVQDKAIFLKSVLAKHLFDIGQGIDEASAEHKQEIEALKTIRPHALITTNYDNMLEKLFEGYESIIGRRVLKYNLNAYGEVYHIHGSIDAPETMVLTKSDYDDWAEESKYFAAKLLTYFAEHPVFIFGYGLGDPNVQTVLQDIGKIVADETGLIANVIQVVYFSDQEISASQSEFALPVGGKQFRIRVLNVNSLLDVFTALTARHELKNVNPALVRALAARVMKLTRSDIPNGNIEVNYQTLESVANSDDALPTMLGITQVDDINKSHPYLLSAVGEQLGHPNWNGANKLLEKIKVDTGIDLKSTDNKYHCAVKVGKKDSSVSRKYSKLMVKLLEKVRDSEDYDIDL